MIKEVTSKDIGKWVEHTPTGEKGIIKTIRDHIIFIVYQCGGNWDNYKDYTACATHIEDLVYTNGTE